MAMMHGWMMGLWWLFALSAVALLAVIAVIAVRRFGGTSDPRRALGLLQERYASGEIDEEEYHRRRRELQSRA
jgi:putative membrane protein